MFGPEPDNADLITFKNKWGKVPSPPASRGKVRGSLVKNLKNLRRVIRAGGNS